LAAWRVQSFALQSDDEQEHWESTSLGVGAEMRFRWQISTNMVLTLSVAERDPEIVCDSARPTFRTGCPAVA